MTDLSTQTPVTGKSPSLELANAHGHDHSHDHDHGHAGHAAHAHGGHAPHGHAAKPAATPAAHMAWSVLSLSVFQRLLLVAPMLVCLWLAVVWAIAG